MDRSRVAQLLEELADLRQDTDRQNAAMAAASAHPNPCTRAFAWSHRPVVFRVGRGGTAICSCGKRPLFERRGLPLCVPVDNIPCMGYECPDCGPWLRRYVDAGRMNYAREARAQEIIDLLDADARRNRSGAYRDWSISASPASMLAKAAELRRPPEPVPVYQGPGGGW